MNEESEGVGELENNRCHIANIILDGRSTSCMQRVCALGLAVAVGL